MEAGNFSEIFNFNCSWFEGYTALRFGLISTASVAALIGMAFNLILAWLFLGPASTSYNSSPLYLGILAICDFLLCLLYLMLFFVDALAYYLRITLAYQIYFFYLECAFITSKVVQLAIPYFVIFATFERILALYKMLDGFWRPLVSMRGRKIVCVVLVFFCTVCHILFFWALTVQEYPCVEDPFRTKEILPTEFFHSKTFQYWDLYVLKTIKTFIPFLLLISLNFMIVYKLKMEKRQKKKSFFLQKGIASALGQMSLIANASSSGLAGQIRRQLEEDNRKVRNAISTMGVIASTYLICNSINVVLTLLERLDSPLLKDHESQQWTSFYIIIGDVLSFMYMVCSVIRLPIYYVFNMEMRREIKALKAKWKFRRVHRTKSMAHKRSRGSRTYGSMLIEHDDLNSQSDTALVATADIILATARLEGFSPMHRKFRVSKGSAGSELLNGQNGQISNGNERKNSLVQLISVL